MKEELQTWERQPDETPKSYAAFVQYRDLGTMRSLSKVAQEYAKPRSKKVQLQRWSSKYNWVARCADYDAYQDELLRKENEAELKKMGKRHAQLSMMLQKKGFDKINKLEEKEITDISIGDALRLTTEGMRYERLARGESTERQDVKHSFEDIFMEAFNEIQKPKPNAREAEDNTGKPS